MRTVTFSETILAEIRQDRYHHPHPRVQRKREVLWLKSRGLTHIFLWNYCLAPAPPSITAWAITRKPARGTPGLCRTSRRFSRRNREPGWSWRFCSARLTHC
jgi:hypothetical protein